MDGIREDRKKTHENCPHGFLFWVSIYLVGFFVFLFLRSPQDFFVNAVNPIFIAFIFNTPIGTFYKIDRSY